MKKLFTLILSISMVLTLAACSNANSTSESQESLLTEVSDVTVNDFFVKICGAKITNKEMETYKLYKGTSDTTNSEGNKKSSEFVGYKLSDVLKVAQVEGNFTSIQVVCSDGYEMTFEGDVNPDNILLACTKDGEAFKDGLWFAPLMSKTTGDFAQDVSKLEIGELSSLLAKDQKDDSSSEEKQEEIAFPQDPISEDKTDKINFADFSFKINGKEITNADLQGLKIYRNTVVTKNSKDVVSLSKYSGYVLKDVLAKLNIAGTKAKTIASDGYEAEFSEEMLNDDLTIIAIEKDKEVGEGGSVWLAPCRENSSGKYAKEVVEIVVE